MPKPLLDRQRELEVLTYLSKFYPSDIDAGEVSGALSSPIPEESNEFVAEAQYLSEHGLVNINATRVTDDGDWSKTGLVVDSLSITARGMDFLKDDGGLSAILGVVTVKLHDDTIKALLIDKVNASDGEKSAKDQLVSAIKSLPAEATKLIAMKLIDHGIAAAPATLAALQKLLSL